YAQPVAAIKDGNAHDDEHYEVLIRMVDESGAIVPPVNFIPAAERYGIMGRLDRWVIERAFAVLADQQQRGRKLRFSINLSAMSMNDEGLVSYLRERFRAHRVDPRQVTFEVTETSAIANLTQSSRMMHELKNLGCRFSLDDFGTGMSSFAYLKHLPVDFVKIDGSFVKDMDTDPIDREMVSSINNMAHVMGMRTVAEFVESQAIIRWLSSIGVDFGQGYGIGRPAPVEDLLRETEYA